MLHTTSLRSMFVMQSVTFTKPGGPEVIETKLTPKPEPKQTELLVKVCFSGVNRPDVFQRQGKYNPPPDASPIPGLEFSGKVVAVGNEVTLFQIGDEVCGLVAGGAYAEFVVVDQLNAMPLPKNVSLKTGAGIPETFCTVWANVFYQQKVSSSFKVLVHGGSSGIGTTAIQLFKLFGVNKVFTTVGSEEKMRACQELGAVPINYKTTNFDEFVLKETNNVGVDIIVDMVGGSYVNRNYNCASKNAHIVQLATLEGVAHDVDVRLIVSKHLTHRGSTLRPRSVEEKGKIIADLVENVWHRFDELSVPLIYAVFDYKDARRAHELMDSSKHIGKILLDFTNTQDRTQ